MVEGLTGTSRGGVAGTPPREAAGHGRSGVPGTSGRVGVLALQGDFALHLVSLAREGVAATEARTAAEIDQLDALVLPGGESTTMLKLMEGTRIAQAVRDLHDRGGTMFGTCAGLILLARGVTGPEQESLGILDIDVSRNDYGRQVDSFETDLPWPGTAEPLRGVFIRAPVVTRVGDDVEVLVSHAGRPVVVRQGSVLGASFHPESTGDTRVHRLFLEMVRAAVAGAVG